MIVDTMKAVNNPRCSEDAHKRLLQDPGHHRREQRHAKSRLRIQKANRVLRVLHNLVKEIQTAIEFRSVVEIRSYLIQAGFKGRRFAWHVREV